MAGNTRLEIQTEAYQVLWEKDLSNEYSPAIVQAKIQNVYSRICHGKVIRLDNWQAINASRLPFLEYRTPIQYYAPSSITGGPYNPGATTLWVADTTNYLTSSYVSIKGNLIKYTGKTATSLTWVTWVTIIIEDGDLVSQVFPISNINIYKPTRLSYITNETEQPCHEMIRWEYTTGQYYTIMNNGEDRYLFIKEYPTGTYRLDYFQEPPALTQDSDKILLPGDAGKEIIAPIAMAELLWKTEEIDFAKEKWVLWYDKLVEFYDNYKRNTKKERQQIGYNFVGSEEIIWPRNGWAFSDDEY